jgi:hypothetical protein
MVRFTQCLNSLDNDPLNPRTSELVRELNRIVASYFSDSPILKNIPLIPTIGNNDIHPHNQLDWTPGSPNEILEFFADLWKEYIPKDQIEIFLDGGYYFTRVGEDIIVVSLNSMYFFLSNTRVGDCVGDTAGDAQLDWLTSVLDMAKFENARVLIIGHAPPIERHALFILCTRYFYENCLAKYRDLTASYSSIIQSEFYGHMNLGIAILLTSSRSLLGIKKFECN